MAPHPSLSMSHEHLSNMEYHIFLTDFFSRYSQDNRGMRKGQAFMNELGSYSMGLYQSVPEDIDPFYDDKLLGACIDWVSERWVDT